MLKRTFAILTALLFASALPLLAGEVDEKELKAGDRDPAFLLKVNTAVQKGIEWLMKQQDDDGTFDTAFKGIHAPNFPGGPTAISLLALLKSGVSRHDEAIKKGFDWLKKQPIRKTYTAALTLMALEARYSAQKVEDRQKGHTAAAGLGRVPVPRDDLDWMKALAVFLLESITYSKVVTQNGVITTKKNVWHYPGNPDGSNAGGADSGDHSNTQYAILGLRSAQRCGVPIPRDLWEEVWVKVIDHFLEVQEKEGPKVQRWKILEDKEHGYVSYRSVTSVPDTARGWTYSTGIEAKPGGKDHSTATTGSMTAVGVASLIIAMEGLTTIRSTKLNSGRRSEINRSVNDGLAWLDHYFAVDKNPGHPQGSWQYYYLYGMERAAVLAGARNLGKHDWYREGADYLVRTQGGNGAWTSGRGSGVLPSTCFALLFLTKATIPGRVKITR